MPFFTAFSIYFLKEQISLNVWISIVMATIGIIIMAFGNSEKNSFIGFIVWDNIIYWFFNFFCNLKMEERNT